MADEPQPPSRNARPRIEDLERPALDDRSYRIITLPNQLEVLLIHDPKTDKASAALDVNVGSFSDAEDMPGIAHAVEHLLFMGTEKYPEENEYNKYLSARSGHSNAYTAATSTNYYFELSATANSPTKDKDSTLDTLPNNKEESALWGALDRFGQFFICPLFLEDTVDREIKAVDSENKKNLQSDTWRLHQLSKALSNPDHPYCHFSTGNWKTLHDEPIARGVKIRDEFMKFHSTHYSANRMKLVILGKESLDTLEEWAEEIFSKVPNKDLPRKRWDDVPVYTKDQLLTQTFAKPVTEMRSLELSFPFRDEEDHYDSRPSRYLSHLIGHEGPGSILSFLKTKGWANSLGAGGSALCPGTGLFNVSVRLTEDGLKNYEEVVKVIFQYIALLSEQPPLQWIAEEQMRMTEVDFRFRQKSPPSGTTSALASIMQKPYDRKMLLSGPSVIRKFDAAEIVKSLEYLTPDNFRIKIVNNTFPGDWDSKEKWYGTEYKSEKMPEAFVASVKHAFENSAKERPQALHLPHKNEFIPGRLDVEKRETDNPLKEPKLIRHDENVRTWYKRDDQFWVPKANVFINIRTPLANATVRTAALTSMFKALVNDSLEEYSYDADLAGLVYDFGSTTTGLSITVEGYSDKLHVLLEKVLVSIQEVELKADRFEILRERLTRALRNWDYGQPYRQIGTYSAWLKSEKGMYMFDEKLRELENITVEDVKEFAPVLLSQGHIEVLAHGNLHKEEALQVTDLVEKILRPKRLPQSQWPVRRNLISAPGSNFVYERQLKDPANVNNCIEYSLYIGANYDRNIRALALLLSQMTHEPAFNQLRTIEQLGYVVFSGAILSVMWAGFRVLVQSEKDCKYLEGRIDHFLTGFEKTLDDMGEDEFTEHKRAAIDKRKEKLKNLVQESNRFWSHISSDGYDFLQADIDADHIEKINKEDMVAFYKEYISPASRTRAKLSVHLTAQAKPKEQTAEERKSETINALATVLKEEKINLDQAALEKRFASLDLSSSTASNEITSTISSHLTEDLKLDSQTGEKILDEAKAALGLAETSAVKATEGGDAEGTAPNGTKPVLITDVQAYKAGLQVSRGVRPVKDLSEFVEGEPKL